jgi:hypothetical protein
MPRALIYMGSIARGANVLYVTAMAAKRPFIGKS